MGHPRRETVRPHRASPSMRGPAVHPVDPLVATDVATCLLLAAIVPDLSLVHLLVLPLSRLRSWFSSWLSLPLTWLPCPTIDPPPESRHVRGAAVHAALVAVFLAVTVVLTCLPCPTIVPHLRRAPPAPGGCALLAKQPRACCKGAKPPFVLPRDRGRARASRRVRQGRWPPERARSKGPGHGSGKQGPAHQGRARSARTWASVPRGQWGSSEARNGRPWPRLRRGQVPRQ